MSFNDKHIHLRLFWGLVPSTTAHCKAILWCSSHTEMLLGFHTVSVLTVAALDKQVNKLPRENKTSG